VLQHKIGCGAAPKGVVPAAAAAPHRPLLKLLAVFQHLDAVVEPASQATRGHQFGTIQGGGVWKSKGLTTDNSGMRVSQVPPLLLPLLVPWLAATIPICAFPASRVGGRTLRLLTPPAGRPTLAARTAPALPLRQHCCCRRVEAPPLRPPRRLREQCRPHCHPPLLRRPPQRQHDRFEPPKPPAGLRGRAGQGSHWQQRLRLQRRCATWHLGARGKAWGRGRAMRCKWRARSAAICTHAMQSFCRPIHLIERVGDSFCKRRYVRDSFLLHTHCQLRSLQQLHPRRVSTRQVYIISHTVTFDRRCLFGQHLQLHAHIGLMQHGSEAATGAAASCTPLGLAIQHIDDWG
jgi:hypothetical protein